METLQFKAGESIVKRRDKVKEWYLVQEGCVRSQIAFVNIKIPANGIIGMLEKDWYLYDYYADTDVTLLVLPCQSAADLKSFLKKDEKMRLLFLRAAILQRHQQLSMYTDLTNRVQVFGHRLDEIYGEYKAIVAKYHVEAQSIYELDNFEPLEIKHKAENWEWQQSNSLMQHYLEEYLHLFIKDESMCIGAIMEASAQMHRVAMGIGEITDFLVFNEEVLISEKRQNLFHLLLSVEIVLHAQGEDTDRVKEQIAKLFSFAEQIGIYSQEFLDGRKEEYQEMSLGDMEVSEEHRATTNKAKNDLDYILLFAGYKEKERAELLNLFADYEKCSNMPNTDEHAYQLRKRVTKEFYEIYKASLKQALHLELEEKQMVPTTILMFLNFGYMDTAFVGEEKADGLYHVADHLDLCQSNHVFTMYEWFKAVYLGEKEPSKNEFDLDYNAYLVEELKQGNIQKSDLETLKQDQVAKLRFEFDNMFKSINRITYGNITMFSPVLRKEDLLGDPYNTMMTTAKLAFAIDEIRKLDYSAFYRPIYYNDMTVALNHEALMTEILPDIILIPNAGSKVMMWQETASVRNDTPARFMVPIFLSGDINEMMIELVGRYRWEICRKIQGVHWNDIREHSLTSDYYDYLQFYRKNRELSSDAKEQIKTSLTRAKNSFREVFVKDYVNYLKYESKGGFRLNKYVRKIIFAYCPFSKNVCAELKENPMFKDAINKHQVEKQKTKRRLQGLYEKIANDGGELTTEMKNHLDFYFM